MKIPYRIPKKFPFVISCLNKLCFLCEKPQYNWTGARVACSNTESIIISKDSKNILYIAEYRTHSIDGVRAGRFNSYISNYMCLLKQAYPKKSFEIDKFLEWVRIEDQKQYYRSKKDVLINEAKELGYSLVKKNVNK